MVNQVISFLVQTGKGQVFFSPTNMEFVKFGIKWLTH